MEQFDNEVKSRKSGGGRSKSGFCKIMTNLLSSAMAIDNINYDESKINKLGKKITDVKK